MSRIQPVFAALQAQGRKALIPYVTCGDPALETMPQVMQALADGGADIIELGVPFSDPMADGPVIQQASERALARGVGLPQVFGAVRAFRHGNNTTPVVLMGYANPIERYDQRMGAGAFVAAARDAGVDGVLVVDYPPEECGEFDAALQVAKMDLIYLLAPTSTDERMLQVGRIARGYVYYVSLKGVTGAGNLDVAAVATMLPRIRQKVQVPVGVGFGIRDAATARAVAQVADAVVIGARLVQLLQDQWRDNATLVPEAARHFMAEVRSAMDA